MQEHSAIQDEHNNAPIISVLMSVYNSSRFLEEALDSILSQTFRDFEFIVADDGSTDNSFEILQKYAAIDSRIHAVSHPNKGIPKTRNGLLAKARGNLIAVMDADDVALPDRFARQVEFLNNNPSFVCVGSSYQIIDEAGRLILDCFTLPEQDEEIQEYLLAGYGGMHHPCLMIRKEAILKTGGYEETMTTGSDVDLFLKLGEVGKLANFREPVLQYRIHNKSITGRNYTKPREEVKAACERAWNRRGIIGEFKAIETTRPGDEREAQHKQTLLYGWWAFGSGQRQTATYYGFKSVRLCPFSIKSWKLFFCALIKPLPKKTFL